VLPLCASLSSIWFLSILSFKRERGDFIREKREREGGRREGERDKQRERESIRESIRINRLTFCAF
jgi:hypothetical protein